MVAGFEELRLRIFAALAGVICLAIPGLSVTPQKSPPPAASKSATAVKRTPSRRTGPSARTRKTVHTSWRAGQMTPTPERYKEIQQALIDKGYLQAPASGVWGPDCSQALKKFQQEQNLTPSGKLDALSIISLGLGPSREPYRPTAVVNNRPPSSGGLN